MMLNQLKSFSINLNTLHVNGMTPLILENVGLLDTLEYRALKP